MSATPSLWSYIANADLVVKSVMLILMAASVASWTVILQRVRLLKQTAKAMKDFEKRFWSGAALGDLFKQTNDTSTGLARIFRAGFSEYTRLMRQPNIAPPSLLEGTQRAMRIAEAQEMARLENHLGFLATVGSTSPYVGLFGTVWGIMTSFQALGTVQQASISSVAPGISEALIATAIGLFAAIPAVIAYNKFSITLGQVRNSYTTFQEEFTNILHREAYS